MYGDWAERIAARIQRRFDEIDAQYNFDLGDEFEIAVAEILRDLLPARAGVCRGFIVARDGTTAGDDIIIFDRVRFPTMRVLGESLALKERVPLEGVLGYIEAKHTLYLAGDASRGTSLAKACKQIRAVAGLPPREQVTAFQIRPFLHLQPDLHRVNARPGFFDHRNPMYRMIMARRIAISEANKEALTLQDEATINAALDREGSLGSLPDVIAAGELFVVPALVKDGTPYVRPVLGPPGVVSHASLIQGGSFGLAVMHLLWTIEQLELGVLPWDDMLAEAARKLKRRT